MTYPREFLWLNIAPAREDLEAYLDENGQPLDWLGALGALTIFVGANNSGKSRFLRFLFKQEKLTLLDESARKTYEGALQA